MARAKSKLLISGTAGELPIQIELTFDPEDIILLDERLQDERGMRLLGAMELIAQSLKRIADRFDHDAGVFEDMVIKGNSLSAEGTKP